MKKIFLLSGLIISLFYLSCNSKKTTPVASAQHPTIDTTSSPADFKKSFEGTVNSRFRINMTLIKTAEKLTGTYMYISQGNPIKISGIIDTAGKLSIREFDADNNVTGIFTGKLKDENISGEWAKGDGSKPVPFSVFQVTGKKAVSSATKPSDEDNWPGTYKSNSGTLKIKGADSEGAVIFELSQTGCGEITEGTAHLIGYGVAQFFEGETGGQLNFTFSSGQIEVEEYDYSHGTSCKSYEGKYKKQL